MAANLEPCPFELDANHTSGAWLFWQGSGTRQYDLWHSSDLCSWLPADGYPKAGHDGWMAEWRPLQTTEFFRMASASCLQDFFYPEVNAYKTATGISTEAANEINLFLRYLRGHRVEPALLWFGGSRYNSITGSAARAVIGGNGTVVGNLGLRGERYETFTGQQAIRFDNPLKNSSNRRVGYFTGAAPASDIGDMGLITGGETIPKGPSLYASWGAATFGVYDPLGNAIRHAGYGGYSKPDTYLPYVGSAFDGFYSVACGIGKSSGSREHPLRFSEMDPVLFPQGRFVNDHANVYLGSPNYAGRLHFCLITASDLTDNRTAYGLIGIPRRSGMEPYSNQTAVVILGDSIMNWSTGDIFNSGGMTPAHHGGGQWSRNTIGLLANATGEGNAAQIEYFEKGARHALDPIAWDHLFFVSGSGGHYPPAEHYVQNPPSEEAKQGIDAYLRENHEQIALKAAALGATVIQLTYIYGNPPESGNPPNKETYRAFLDYRYERQLELARSASFQIVDLYKIPQLNAPIPAFYADQIHPTPAGARLIAQEFAAAVQHPTVRSPRSLNRPVISGTPVAGNILFCSQGSWALSPTIFAYQWMRDATDIQGATLNNYTVTSTDIGFHISCRVTASNALGVAERTSAHTAMVRN